MSTRHRLIVLGVLALFAVGCSHDPCVVTAKSLAATDAVVKAGAKTVAILCAEGKLSADDCRAASKAQDDYVVVALTALDMAQAACTVDAGTPEKVQKLVEAAAANAVALFNTFAAKGGSK